MMKDTSTAPAITVLHMSSQSCSVDQEDLLELCPNLAGHVIDSGVTEIEL